MKRFVVPLCIVATGIFALGAGLLILKGINPLLTLPLVGMAGVCAAIGHYFESQGL